MKRQTNLKIISGKYKSKPIAYPKDRQFRATQSKVREAIFNITQAYIQGAVFLDCCCGTASMGIEALSRGAHYSICVDQNTYYADKNSKGIDNIMVVRQDIVNFLKHYHHRKASIVFIDPPWNCHHIYEKILSMIFDSDILSEEAIVICEHHKSYDIPLHNMSASNYYYGDTAITMVSKT